MELKIKGTPHVPVLNSISSKMIDSISDLTSLSTLDIKAFSGSSNSSKIETRRRGPEKKSAPWNLFGTTNGSEIDERKRSLMKRSASLSNISNTAGASIGNEIDRLKRGLEMKSASLSDLSMVFGNINHGTKREGRKKRHHEKRLASTSDLKKVLGSSDAKKADDERNKGRSKRLASLADLSKDGGNNKADKRKRCLERSASLSGLSDDDDTKTSRRKRGLEKKSSSCSDLSPEVCKSSSHGHETDARKKRGAKKKSESSSDNLSSGVVGEKKKHKSKKDKAKGKKSKKQKRKNDATSTVLTAIDEETECKHKKYEKIADFTTTDEGDERTISMLETRLKIIETMKKLDMDNLQAWKIESKWKLEQKRLRRLNDHSMLEAKLEEHSNAERQQQQNSVAIIEELQKQNKLLHEYLNKLTQQREKYVLLNDEHRIQYRQHVVWWEQEKIKYKAEQNKRDHLDSLKQSLDTLQDGIKSHEKKCEMEMRMKQRIKTGIDDIVEVLGCRCTSIFLFLDVKKLADELEPTYNLFLSNDSYTEDMTVMTESSDVSYGFVASENPIVSFDPLKHDVEAT